MATFTSINPSIEKPLGETLFKPGILCFLLLLIVFILALPGCGSMRIHDPGRMTVARDTADLANEFSATGGAVFEPMEANLDAVVALQDELTKRLIEHDSEAFLNVMTDLTPDEIGDRITLSIDDRNQLFREFSASEKQAIANIDSALDRQSRISNLSKEKTGLTGSGELEKTIERLDNRLDWLDEGLDRFLKVTSTLGGASTSLELNGSIGELLDLQGNASADAATVQEFVENAQSALDSIEEDEQVVAAKKLLAVAVQQASQSEQARLLEMRRHLSEIRRLQSRLITRDQVAICTPYVSVALNLYPALLDPSELLRVHQDLMGSGRYQCLFPLNDSDPEIIEEQKKQKENWASRSLSGYVAATFADAKRGAADDALSAEEKQRLEDFARSAAEFVAGFGVLVLYEDRMIQDSLDQLYQEFHLHSIRLSKISASQRGDLVHQLSEGLAVYYQGGIKPEEVAELLLFTAQVGALFFIGASL